MKFWIAISHTDTEHLVPISQRAEALGFEGVLLADHMFVPEKIESKYPYSPDGGPPFASTIHHPDVWAAMTAVAAATTSLRLSIATYILPLHDVFETARGAATAAVLSGGRVHFSVGAGWMRAEMDLFGATADGMAFRFGLGSDFWVSDHFGFRVEGRYLLPVSKSIRDLSSISPRVGMFFRF